MTDEELCKDKKLFKLIKQTTLYLLMYGEYNENMKRKLILDTIHKITGYRPKIIETNYNNDETPFVVSTLEGNINYQDKIIKYHTLYADGVRPLFFIYDVLTIIKRELKKDEWLKLIKG